MLVTGGSGFPGSYVVDRLRRADNDLTQLDAVERRSLDTRKALSQFGFRAHVHIREGLRRTVERNLARR
ncbi:MAG TPA: NAD-dependent epimerase/dehydratase family protein [Longimicrobium sp.]|nr:NAD-dependent epimerase/dehydratase family protein [Longimicrobium sp.]